MTFVIDFVIGFEARDLLLRGRGKWGGTWQQPGKPRDEYLAMSGLKVDSCTVL